jgi:hypothetical protein
MPGHSSIPCELLVSLLATGTITTADTGARVFVTSGKRGAPYYHLFRRSDGSQVLFVYDTTASPTVDVQLTTAGGSAYTCVLNGTSAAYTGFRGHVLRDLHLTMGHVAIFKFSPDHG